MRKILIPLTCVLALAAADGLRRAPGFALPDTSLHFHDLADFRGKVLVLEFMQTSCPHCLTFAGVLAKLPQKYGDKVAILAVANVNNDPPARIAEFVSAHNISYPVVMDQGQMMFSYLNSPKGAEVPHVYVIDANGNIRYDHVYNVTTRDIFEGNALFTEIDRVLGEAGKK